MPTSLVIAALGVWLIVTPLVPMSAAHISWNYWIVGLTAGILGALTPAEPDERWPYAMAVATAAWLLLSGAVPMLQHGGLLFLNCLMAGGLLLFVGGADAPPYVSDEPHSHRPVS